LWKKAKEMSINIPEPPKPVAAYASGVKVGEFIYASGRVPLVNGELKYKGKVEVNVTMEEAYEAARICALNCLGVVKSLVGDLDKIEKVVKVAGFANSTPESVIRGFFRNFKKM
jgi:enamine deaminase RidA (YjgF/YER057c/UK114 family)